MGELEVGAWIEAYRRAWETGDDELMASLFTEDANYRSAPFSERFAARTRSRSYARRNAGTQRGQARPDGPPLRRRQPRRGRVVDDHDPEGEAVTLPGCLRLRFAADGRCSELREYWHVQPGTHEPFADWGT